MSYTFTAKPGSLPGMSFLVSRIAKVSPAQFHEQRTLSIGLTAAATAVVASALGGLVLHYVVRDRAPGVDAFLKQIAAKTEPVKMTKVGPKASRYLARVYGKTAIGFTLAAAGTQFFFKFPQVPLAPFVVATFISSTAIIAAPTQPIARDALFALATFSSGVAFGPLNWIALDTTKFIAVAAVSTALSFSTTAMLTRGKLSFLLSSHALSSSVTYLAAKALLVASTLRATSAETGRPVIVSEAIAHVFTQPMSMDLLYVMQSAAGAAAVLLHAMPVLAAFASAEAAQEAAAPAAAAAAAGAGPTAGAADHRGPGFRNNQHDGDNEGGKKGTVSGTSGESAAIMSRTLFGIGGYFGNVPVEDGVAGLDSTRDAVIIFNNAMVMFFSGVRRLIRRVFGLKGSAASSSILKNGILGSEARSHFDQFIDGASLLGALLAYLRLIMVLQRSDKTGTVLNFLRSVFRFMTPVALVSM